MARPLYYKEHFLLHLPINLALISPAPEPVLVGSPDECADEATRPMNVSTFDGVVPRDDPRLAGKWDCTQPM